MKAKKKRILIGAGCGVFVILIIVAAIILHFVFLPQVQVVDAMVNTLSTTKQSEIDKKYGGYDIFFGVAGGNYDCMVSYEDMNFGIQRNKETHQFLGYSNLAVMDRQEFLLQFYVDSETSVLAYNDSSIQVDYTNDMEEKVTSSILSVLGFDQEDLQTGTRVYIDLMEALAGTAERDTNIFDQLFERTKDLFLNLESERCDKKTFTINGKDEKCQVYRITFNAKDLAEYIQDCYDISFSTGERMNQLVQSITGYDLDELFALANEEAEKMQDLDLYFAVNDDDQLVSIYGSNITEDNIDIELNFLGGSYLCDEVEFHLKDDTGREITFYRDDISDGNQLAVEYTFTITGSDGITTEHEFTYTFEDNKVSVATDLFGTEGVQIYTADITSYEKGKYIEITGNNGTSFYIGTAVRDIECPIGSENLNLLDADILTASEFIKSFMGDEDE